MLQINSKTVLLLMTVSLLLLTQLSMAQEKEVPVQVLITNVTM